MHDAKTTFYDKTVASATLDKAYQCSLKLGFSLKYHRLFK